MTWIPSVSLGSNAEELSPGVIVERRRLFWLPVAAAGLLLGRGTARGESTPGQPGEDGKITTDFGGDGTFSFIDFEPDKPKDAEKRLFEAVWIGSKL